jgi:hypothetical protein
MVGGTVARSFTSAVTTALFLLLLWPACPGAPLQPPQEGNAWVTTPITGPGDGANGGQSAVESAISAAIVQHNERLQRGYAEEQLNKPEIQPSHESLSGPSKSRAPSSVAARGADATSHNTTLTHVVIPLAQAQSVNLHHMLQDWAAFPPCAAGDKVLLARAGVSLPTLHVIVARRREINITQQQDDVAEQMLRLRVSTIVRNGLANLGVSCFSSSVVHVLPLSAAEDTHLTGARLLLEAAIGRGPVSPTGERGYAVQLEPDVRPVRARWLTTLSLSVMWPVQPFFIMGGMYMGNDPGILNHPFAPVRFHINGNALYRISCLDDFQEPAGAACSATSPLPSGVGGFAGFYFNTIRPWAVKYYGKEYPPEKEHPGYDLVLSDWVINARTRKTGSDMVRMMATRVVARNLIVNMQFTKFTRAALRQQFREVLLVHGGVILDDGEDQIDTVHKSSF